MQRSITYKTPLTYVGIIIAFSLYQSLSSVYLLLPPLLGVLLVYFIRTLEEENLSQLLLLIVLLLIFEADKDFLLFSSLVYFTFIYRFIITRLRVVTSCEVCLKVLNLFLAYPGFLVYSYVLNQVLWLEVPTIDWHILYYMLVELFVVLSI